MNLYRRLNISLGWLVFIVAAITYISTVEPTMSLWDCGEYITSGYKLEPGHPPGAPTFMLVARLFSLFASDVSKVALMVNLMSALASALTIMFLFWTITHFARRITIGVNKDTSLSGTIAIMGAGLAGALAYTFSDSFWFSAVEGEVYAMSSLFTAITFWAILKWENEADEAYSNRWLLLIAYLIGLSIGVHLLNLLAIPAVVYIYYFKKYEFSWKGFGLSIAISLVLLAFVMWGLVSGFFTVATRFELMLVNGIGLPYNSGLYLLVLLFALFLILAIRSTLDNVKPNRTTIFTIVALLLSGVWLLSGSLMFNLLILALLAWGVYYLAKNKVAVLNTILTSLMLVMIGFSSFALIMIRSSANPPMDENNPETAFQMLYYLNREQYPKQPLVKGPYYNAPLDGYKEGKPQYSPVEGRYEITNHAVIPEYDDNFVTLFPRMYSPQSDHVSVYKEWVPVKGRPIQVTGPDGQKRIEYKPTFGENLKFMFSYQVGYMYFRYFMWNFSGRQNDIQGAGGPFNGNWITGFDFLDEPRFGPTEDIPGVLKNIPSRNVYFMLPLLLGLIGLYFQLNKDIKNFWVVLLLFIMTGLAIVVYLNQYPNQPRERDYAYAASFYAFAIWIGMGVLFLYEMLAKLAGRKLAVPFAVLAGLLVPVIMGVQNWDDHDRSGRYTATAVAKNYLLSCAPNAVLFTNGDNDTFPLWYAQEVEEIGTDVRVCNLMLFNTDWFIDQMKHKMNDSDPMPLSLPRSKYYDGVNNQVYIIERIKDPVNIKQLIEFINNEDPATKYRFGDGVERDYIPSRKVRIPVDKEKVLANGTVKPEDADKIVPYIDITLKGNYILKSQLMVLDFFANNNWERPVYYVAGYHDDAFGLEEYFQLEGNAYRLVPIKSHNRSWLDYGRIDTEILYENLMNKFEWGNANDESVVLDYYHKRTLSVIRARLSYAKLAKALVLEGDKNRAVEVLDHVMNELPLSQLPWDMFMPDVIEAYLQAGAKDRAYDLISQMRDYYGEILGYYTGLRSDLMRAADYEIQTSLGYLSRVSTACINNDEEELGNEISDQLQLIYQEYVTKMQGGVPGF